MRLGYKASAEQFAPSALLDFAVEAEQAGFDSVRSIIPSLKQPTATRHSRGLDGGVLAAQSIVSHPC